MAKKKRHPMDNGRNNYSIGTKKLKVKHKPHKIDDEHKDLMKRLQDEFKANKANKAKQ